jgi:hypothetical protein
VRASIYPILPTTDYTPLPADPAAVYKPTTLQLLDIPGNDAVGLGIGTEDPLVPSEGIGGEARSTSSCNPGCWEDLYELVDLQINTTLKNTPGFRNPLFGSNTRVSHVELPEDTVPVFIVIGDSTAQGFSVTSPSATIDADAYRNNTAVWLSNAYDGSAYGYFWDKFMTSEDNGVTWTKTLPDYFTADTSGSQFLPIHPRLGGINPGTFTFSATPNDIQLGSVGGCSPVWDFAVDISGLFQTNNGDVLAPHFIYLGVPQSRIGSDGPTVAGYQNFNFSPSGGLLFNTLVESYIKPAADAILNVGKNPLLVGTIIMHGATEANVAYNPNQSGNKVALSAAQSYANVIAGIVTSCKLGGRMPYMAYEAWDTGLTFDEGTVYPPIYTDMVRKALRSIKNVHINRHPILQDLARDGKAQSDGSLIPAASIGVHFLQKEYPLYGKRFATQYRSLLSMNRYPLYGRTLSDLFDEQY